MTKMIALVADDVDAAAALAGGVRRVAVRLAVSSTMDQVDLARFAAIRRAVGDRCAVSLWCATPMPDIAAALSACGADEVWAPVTLDLPPGVSRWIVRSLADPVLAEDATPGAGLLIAGDEGPGRLLQQVAIDRLAAQVRIAHDRGRAVRIAGSMEPPDLPRLRALAPEALVGGDMLRSGGRLDTEKVKLAVALLEGGEALPQAAAAVPGEPDRIFVRDWTVALHVGAYSHETEPQRVRFSVEAEMEASAGRAADMRDVVTYDLITDAIARATATHVALVETIAADVAAMVLAHPRVTAVDITVEKLDLGPGSLGCRIRRRRAPT